MLSLLAQLITMLATSLTRIELERYDYKFRNENDHSSRIR